MMLPVAFYAPVGFRLNLSLADILVPVALAAAITAGGVDKARRPPLLACTLVLHIALWASLARPTWTGELTDVTAGALSATKLVVAATYLLWFHAGARSALRKGDSRFMFIWRTTAATSALIGIAGVAANAVGIDLSLSYVYRATGTFEDPNAFAVYLMLSLGVTMAYNAHTAGRPLSWHLFPIVTALVLTGSRAALVSLGVAALGTAIIAGSGKRARQFRHASVGALLGTAVLLTVLPSSWTGSALGRALSVFSGEVEDDVRATLWRLAGRLWSENPLLGVGIGQFRLAASNDVGSRVELIAHNTYLSFAAETGLVGFLAFFAVPAIAVAAAYRAHTLGSPAAVFLLFALVSVAVQAFTLNIENFRPLWAFTGILLALTYSPLGTEARIAHHQGAPAHPLPGTNTN